MTFAPVQRVLDRLPSAKPAGAGKWKALCPVHEADGNGHKASLSIAQGDDGKVLLNCKASCATADVVKALKLTMADLFEDHPKATHKPAPRTAKGRIVKTYDYLDETGALLFQVVRYDPKDFRQRRPDGKGGWIWNMADVRRVLYRLRELLAADKSEWVFLTAGEKDADNVAALDLTSTTNPGGENKWRAEYSETLRGRRVCILAHKDAPGRKHAHDVTRQLSGIAAGVRIVELPDVGDEHVKDVSDWINALDAKDSEDLAKALVEMASAAPPWTPTPEVPTVAEDDALADGDVRLGAEFAAAFSDRVRYCPDFEAWLVWDRRRWALDAVHGAERLMQDLARKRLASAAHLTDSGAREDEIKFWTQAMRRNRIEAALWAARSDPRLIVRLTALDADPWLLNVANGTLDLKTGQLRRHDPADLITKMAPVKFDPDADMGEWNRSLARWMPIERVREYLQRAAGASIIGTALWELLFFICGPTAGGKSTFVAAVSGALGDYSATANFASFLEQKNKGGPRPDIVRLVGKRFVSSIETEEGVFLAEGCLKWLTGGDTICERGLYVNEIEFLPTFTLWLVSNFLPRAKDDDGALWRRLMLLEFPVSIPEAERDPAVKERLRDPTIGGPAVLRWLVEGCMESQKRGLKTDVPPEVTAATRRWRAENDPIIDWLSERATLDPSIETPFKDLNKNYRAWAEDVGIPRPISGKKLAERLQDHGCRKGSGAGHVRTYEGIGLK